MDFGIEYRTKKYATRMDDSPWPANTNGLADRISAPGRKFDRKQTAIRILEQVYGVAYRQGLDDARSIAQEKK